MRTLHPRRCGRRRPDGAPISCGTLAHAPPPGIFTKPPALRVLYIAALARDKNQNAKLQAKGAAVRKTRQDDGIKQDARGWLAPRALLWHSIAILQVLLSCLL